VKISSFCKKMADGDGLLARSEGNTALPLNWKEESLTGLIVSGIQRGPDPRETSEEITFLQSPFSDFCPAI
jgi:hypothetical protein